MIGSTSQHFSSLELRCKGLTCGLYKNGCRENRSTPELTQLLEKIRLAVNQGNVDGDVKVIIHDATRCEEHNGSTRGSAANSQHPQGTAADIEVPGMTAVQLEAVVLNIPEVRGMGRSSKNWVHVDVRHSVIVAKWCYKEDNTTCEYFPATESVGTA